MNKKQVNEPTVNHEISGVYILIFDHGGVGVKNETSKGKFYALLFTQQFICST